MSVLVMTAVVVVVVVVAVDTLDCLYICIGDGGGPPRSSSISFLIFANLFSSILCALASFSTL
jgi:hypothetical protein